MPQIPFKSELKNAFRNTPLHGPLKNIRDSYGSGFHEMARRRVELIKPEADSLYITLTADCNLRCQACNYGRDFMPQQQLPWTIGEGLVDDAKTLGFRQIRLYGGEPLLHRDLEKYIRRITDHGMDVFVTTNGVLLKKKIQRMYEAGLRRLSVGYYGSGATYDEYVQRKGAYNVMRSGVEAVRERYDAKAMRLRIEFLLIRHTASIEALDEVFRFARENDAEIYINLVHYSLPYFANGEASVRFSFDETDRPLLSRLADHMIRAKRATPGLIANSEIGLSSIPDWLIRKEKMDVPCTAYKLVWIGADGTVQLCYVTFELGNLHEKRLAEMLNTPEHTCAARDAFKLNCPRCHCRYDERITQHLESRRHYAKKV